MATNTAELKVADHFPSVHLSKQCKEQAAKFFYCFSVEGQQMNGVDPEAGARGLSRCQQLMDAYDTCMKKNATNKKKN